ncbi:hypothetical protein, conserved [Trypanosoma brucei brucei TREU927]|uniref:Uncharacterized protein n=1 Tax=Trypanosoma brucei brucei (strain 927/4 GUTat10.1) TaxID=185431 RepID=Q585S2_TRYB2|nr:hypothetical protein, conserved [Trypanosoma brucei brucei TREU927]AAQ15631.1 hypothetical protein, conserved [Trypanosoma brucei brucei TREU927]AAX79538.1 hypothetical protein, conserved [Trypanosoma brucei]
MNTEDSSLFTLKFLSVRAVIHSLRYLCSRDASVRFVVSVAGGSPEVRLTRVGVPDYSYTEVVLRAGDAGKKWKEVQLHDSNDEDVFSFVIHGPLLLRTLQMFERSKPVKLGLCSDLTSIFLYSDGYERWVRLGVFHDLGPMLNVRQPISALHRVADLQAFCHIARFVRNSQDGTCVVVLGFDNMNSFIELRTTEAMVSVLLDGETLRRRYEGRAGKEEVTAFAEYASRVADDAVLSVGFGTDGLAVFQLKWGGPPAHCEESSAYLYFCAI